MIFITGATGLVGSHLLQKLLQYNQPVCALYRSVIPAFEGSDKVKWINGDILDVIALQEAMQGVKQVYHCAAMVSFHPSQREELFKVNIEGTANVVNAALHAGVDKFCFVSSVAALGRIRKDGVEINESMQWSEETNNSKYGQSKYLAELEVWRGMGEGLQTVIVNPSIILGSSNWDSGSAGLFKSAYDEFAWYSNGVTGFVDVIDLVNAMTALMETDINGERFIVSGENHSYKELFTAIANGFGKKPPVKNITPFIAGLVWRWEALKSWVTGMKPLLTKETARTGLATVHFDHSKILKFLPQFSFTPFHQTITRVCKEFEERYNLK